MGDGGQAAILEQSPRPTLSCTKAWGLTPGPHNQGHSVTGAKLLRASRGLDGALLSPRQREEDRHPRSRHNAADEGPDPAAQGHGAGPQPCHHPPQNTTGPKPVPILVAVPALSHWGPTWHPAPSSGQMSPCRLPCHRNVGMIPRDTPLSTCWRRVGWDGTRTLKEK